MPHAFRLPLPRSFADDMVIAKLASYTWLAVDRIDDDLYADENRTILNYTNIEAPYNYITARLSFYWSYT